MLPFWISIAVLSIVQGTLVAIPRGWAWGGEDAAAPEEDAGSRTFRVPPVTPRALRRLGGRRWALIPPASVILFVLVTSLAERASANGLTYLALVAVPILAALSLGWLAWYVPPSRPLPAVLVLGLFALAWADHGGLAGDAAALALSALSCAALGSLIAAVTPPRWLAAGIVAMAIADTVLVVSDLLQKPNNALNAAHPPAGLPQLQRAVFGSALMGYGDLFVAGALGALLAGSFGRRVQLHGAILAGAFALAFDLLFFFVHELPATVPVALTLLVLSQRARARTPAAAGASMRGEAAPPCDPRDPPAQRSGPPESQADPARRPAAAP
jgi:hypothetical protein